MHYQNGAGHHVPSDPLQARIGGRKEFHRFDRVDDSFVRFYTGMIGQQRPYLKSYRLGYPIHACCWVLLDRVFEGGTTFVKTKLNVLVRAVRNYWRDHKSLWGIYSWIPEDELDEDEEWETPEMNVTLKHGCDLYKNPLVVPEVQEAINRARNAGSKRNGKRKLPCSLFTGVPLDVAILIAEQVCPLDYTVADVENMRNILLAFQWVLPEWFWWRRCNEDLIFELDDLKNDASPSIDLQLLRLDLMSLLADKERYIRSGLANRERTLGLLRSIKANFPSKGR